MIWTGPSASRFIRPYPHWVYVANNNSVVRFRYRNGDLKARAAAEVIVPHLCDTTGGHTTRDVAFSGDGKRMFISVGSGSNVAEGMPKKDADEVPPVGSRARTRCRLGRRIESR